MISQLLSRVISLGLGTLYPAYASYKAIRTKNVKEYVKWMMYWVIFALFTSAETFTDFFLSWFPFYYEIKIILLIYLLSPATKGSSLLYRKFVHPALLRREQRIDELINQAQEQGYRAVIDLGQKGVRYASTVVMESVMRAPNVMAEIVNSGQLAVADDRGRRDHTDGLVVPLAGPPNIDVDMSDVEEVPAEVEEVITEEEKEDEVQDQFDLEEEEDAATHSKRRQPSRSRKTEEAMSYSSNSGDDLEEDPNFQPRTAKKSNTGRGGKKATTTRKSTRKAKSTKST